MDWKKTFADIPDFRREHVFKKHLLSDVLMLSLCAVVCGAETDEEIETYGREKEAFLGAFLDLPNSIPSHDTITRVFRYLDKDKFSSCLCKHSESLREFLAEQHISIDGKVCRTTNPNGMKKGGICIITTWAFEQNLCLGQFKTEEKSKVWCGACKHQSSRILWLAQWQNQTPKSQATTPYTTVYQASGN
jgi:hypothetical protein